MPRSKSIKFEDLGLKTPLPFALKTVAREQRRSKNDIKKEKAILAKKVLENLECNNEIIKQHQLFKKDEAQRLNIERQSRKLQIELERKKSQRQRSKKEFEEELRNAAFNKEAVERIRMKRAKDETEAKIIPCDIDPLQMISPNLPSANVFVDRTTEVNSSRQRLPVVHEEQRIMELINEATRTAVIICGETGSGKTTQIPQFLWENGYGHSEGKPFGRDGMVVVTEPRRVAAVSMAKRVSDELGEEFGDTVSYHVRYKHNVGDRCRLKFVTEGILLKEIESDFLLSHYSAVVIDEAHERSIFCDLLLALLSRIVPLRYDLFVEQLQNANGDATKTSAKPLKLIIMSATLRVSDFVENNALFPYPPPLLSVDVRSFPIFNHFSRNTTLTDYCSTAFDKICQIHESLPPGGILVFLPTQRDIEFLCDKLKKYYHKRKVNYDPKIYRHHSKLVSRQKSSLAFLAESSDRSFSTQENHDACLDEYGLHNDDYTLKGDENDKEEMDHFVGSPGFFNDDFDYGSLKEPVTNLPMDQFDTTAPTSSFLTSLGEEFSSEEVSESSSEKNQTKESHKDCLEGIIDSLYVLPLYAMLNIELQQRVFHPPPQHKRLCVIATNIAETSLTIPHIRYVVDTGRVKTKLINPTSGGVVYQIGWISQSSAEQRSGRAARLGPGHCYRLYSTAVFANLMPQHQSPEILRTSIDSVVLIMKNMGIQNVRRFPFPTPPPETEVCRALEHLSILGALNSENKFAITNLGREIIQYPVPPRYARIIFEGYRQSLSVKLQLFLLASMAVVSISTLVFTHSSTVSYDTKRSESVGSLPLTALKHSGSDFLTYLRIFGFFYVNQSSAHCSQFNIAHRTMVDANKLFHQLWQIHFMKKHNNDELPDPEEWIETECASPIKGLKGDEFYFHTYLDKVGLPKISIEEELILRKVFIVGLLDHVARRATPHECLEYGVAYHSKKISKIAYIETNLRIICYINSSSSCINTSPTPDYLLYGHLQHSENRSNSQKTTIHGITVVTKEWLLDMGYPETVENGL